MELDYKAIGKRIKIARIKADLTQERLACILFFGVVFALLFHAAETLLRFRMDFRQLHIFFIARNSLC